MTLTEVTFLRDGKPVTRVMAEPLADTFAL
jgi:hypothetical protein